jgi:hypothetical protein
MSIYKACALLSGALETTSARLTLDPQLSAQEQCPFRHADNPHLSATRALSCMCIRVKSASIILDDNPQLLSPMLKVNVKNKRLDNKGNIWYRRP